MWGLGCGWRKPNRGLGAKTIREIVGGAQNTHGRGGDETGRGMQKQGKKQCNFPLSLEGAHPKARVLSETNKQFVR